MGEVKQCIYVYLCVLYVLYMNEYIYEKYKSRGNYDIMFYRLIGNL